MIAPFSKFYGKIWVGFCLNTVGRKSLWTISGNLERFQYCNFEIDFLENENLFQKAGIFRLKALRLKAHHFHKKLPHQKPMLRKIEWWVQNGPIIKNGALPVTTFFFWKFCFSLRTSYKGLIWCTNDPNAHIPTFSRR